jgi:hypothetical protein
MPCDRVILGNFRLMLSLQQFGKLVFFPVALTVPHSTQHFQNLLACNFRISGDFCAVAELSPELPVMAGMMCPPPGCGDTG